MVKREKRLEALRQNPRHVRPDELDVVLVDLGFTAAQHGTSHKVYRYGGHQLSVPQRKPLKTVYVKKALALIDALGLADDEDDEEEESGDGSN